MWKSIVVVMLGLAWVFPSHPEKSKESYMADERRSSPPSVADKEIATLGGGCFWCLEAVFEEMEGVKRVVSGYAGGTVKNPTYEQVCTGTTGHAEVVQIEFDPRVVTFDDVLGVFFTVHDPTTRDRQGADVGSQYRSAIFYHGDRQKETAGRKIEEIESDKLWKRPIVTELVPFTVFYEAEDYHQDYFEKNPEAGYCRAVVAPKVLKFREIFPDRVKE